MLWCWLCRPSLDTCYSKGNICFLFSNEMCLATASNVLLKHSMSVCSSLSISQSHPLEMGFPEWGCFKSNKQFLLLQMEFVLSVLYMTVLLTSHVCNALSATVSGWSSKYAIEQSDYHGQLYASLDGRFFHCVLSQFTNSPHWGNCN